MNENMNIWMKFGRNMTLLSMRLYFRAVQKLVIWSIVRQFLKPDRLLTARPKRLFSALSLRSALAWFIRQTATRQFQIFSFSKAKRPLAR